MATFSILTREGKRAPTSSPTAGAAKPHLAEPTGKGKIHPAPHAAADDTPPRVALQLPNVTASEEDETIEAPIEIKKFRWSEVVYWTGIALGTALAIYLIRVPQREAPRSNDEAPAWSPPALATPATNPAYSSAPAASAPAADPSNMEPPVSVQAAPPVEPPAAQDATVGVGSADQIEPQAPIDQQAPPVQPNEPSEGPLIHNGPARRAPDVHSPPAPGGGYVNGPGQPPLRSASGPSPRWDGSSNHVRPSEAAPLGITTPVTQ